VSNSPRGTDFLNCLDLEDGTNRLSWNISMELLLYAALNSRRAEISFTSQWKPEITQICHTQFSFDMMSRRNDES
jgi:hypothetical protein